MYLRDIVSECGLGSVVPGNDLTAGILNVEIKSRAHVNGGYMTTSCIDTHFR
jgi:hypothetical protein